MTAQCAGFIAMPVGGLEGVAGLRGVVERPGLVSRGGVGCGNLRQNRLRRRGLPSTGERKASDWPVQCLSPLALVVGKQRQTHQRVRLCHQPRPAWWPLQGPAGSFRPTPAAGP